MSLLIPGIARAKSVVLMLAVTLAASMTLLGVPSASASSAGVTVTPGESFCEGVYKREIVNNSSQSIYWSAYEVRNGVRTPDSTPKSLEPGGLFRLNTTGKYFGQQLGVKTGVLVATEGSPATIVWTDWGATAWDVPSNCPMIAPAKLLKRTKKITKGPKPLVWYKTTAYFTDLGYRVVGKGKQIKWVSEFMHDGTNVTYGPRLKFGKTLKVKFYSRNRDDAQNKTAPVYIGTKKFKRVRR